MVAARHDDQESIAGLGYQKGDRHLPEGRDLVQRAKRTRDQAAVALTAPAPYWRTIARCRPNTGEGTRCAAIRKTRSRSCDGCGC